MLDERKSDVLKAVIEAYTDTAQPVGSSAIESLDNFSVSAATIRNDMAALESEGYLRQPHTSAGRVPTQKGYRHFVDHIDRKELVSGKSTKQVSDFFSTMRGEIEEVLRDTAGLLSRLTDYAAVVVDGPEDSSEIRSCQLVQLHGSTVLAVVVFSNGQISKQTLDITFEINEENLSKANTLLNSSLCGLTMSKVSKLNSINGENDLANAVLLSLKGQGSDSGKVYVEGASRVVNAFEAVESVSHVLSILEQQLVVVSLLAEVTDTGVSVSIGNETGIATLAECSIVVSPYEIDGSYGGSIAVLGPTRMKYPEAISAVAAVSSQLGERLSEG